MLLSALGAAARAPYVIWEAAPAGQSIPLDLYNLPIDPPVVSSAEQCKNVCLNTPGCMAVVMVPTASGSTSFKCVLNSCAPPSLITATGYEMHTIAKYTTSEYGTFYAEFCNGAGAFRASYASRSQCRS